MSNKLKNQEPVLVTFFGEVVQWKSGAETPDKPLSPSEKIAMIKLYCDGLVITGPDDKNGLETAKAALRKLVSFRTGIDKKRKELKAEIDGEAKRLSAELAPIEAHVKKIVDDVEEIAKNAEAAKRKLRIENMTQAGYNQPTEGVFMIGMAVVTEKQLYDATDEQYRLFIEKGLAETARLEVVAENERKLAALLAEKQQAESVVVETPPANTTAPSTELMAEPPVKEVLTDTASLFEQPVAAVPVSSPAPVQPELFAEKTAVDLATNTLSDYEMGFADCKTAVLRVLKSPMQLTRADWIAHIEKLTAGE